MGRTTFVAMVLTAALAAASACSPEGTGDRAGSAAAAEGAAADRSGASGTAASGEAPEASGNAFVLCPAVEEIADDLASLAGFELDRSRSIAAGARECFVRGDGGAFVMVALAPDAVPSVAEHASGYPGRATPAPELGESAVAVEDATQPHVVFELDGHIVDVGIENFDDPADRPRVIEAGRMVRQALGRANGS